MNKILGIDLGTTYSCVAYVDDYGKANSLKNSEGLMTTPSVVYFESEEKQIVGTEAKAYAVMEPENTVSFIKREMGKEYRRKIYGVDYTPQELSAKILKKLVQDANDTMHEQSVIPQEEEVKKVVITCPAYFGLAEKEATKAAGEIAGLEVLDIINEPTAAAINYGVLNSEKNRKVMVYDLGGGTFDVTIIEIGNKAINVVCTGGDPTLGGKDWDQMPGKSFGGGRKKENDTDEEILEDLDTMSSLMEAAEKAKKALTTKEQAPIVINHEGSRMKLKISREEYDGLTRPLLERTIRITNSCLEDAKAKGISLDNLDEILPVGGSSRMPQVKAMMEETYHLPVELFDPDEAVAKGAALYAQNLDSINVTIEEIAKKTNKDVEEIRQQVQEGADVTQMAEEADVSLAAAGGEYGGLAQLTINNVSSRTYGVDVIDSFTGKKFISNFIFQNDTLPKTNTQTFYTLKDNQSGVRFVLYESLGREERIDNLENATAITTIDMKFKKPVPKGTEIVTTLRLENSGLIYMEAEEMLNHSKLEASYDVKNALSKEEMRDAIQRAQCADID